MSDNRAIFDRKAIYIDYMKKPCCDEMSFYLHHGNFVFNEKGIYCTDCAGPTWTNCPWCGAPLGHNLNHDIEKLPYFVKPMFEETDMPIQVKKIIMRWLYRQQDVSET